MTITAGGKRKQRGPRTAITVREDEFGLVVSAPSWLLRRWWRFALWLAVAGWTIGGAVREGMWLSVLFCLVILLPLLLPHRVEIAPDRWAVAGRSRRRRWDHVEAVQVGAGEAPTVLLRLTDGALVDTHVPGRWADRVAGIGRVPMAGRETPGDARGPGA